ncbi:MAG: alpha/beta hydrolase [Bifidobacteriaceae bacterium]|jgi:acetyl esterase|nr:alpha/beta hydrolase [Bifidobacteriaceae bacterium]
MPLDPILVPLVEALRSDLPQVPIAQARREAEANSAAQVGVAIEPGPPDVTAATFWVPGPAGAPPVKVKAYRTAGSPPALRPGLVYLHGGGWTLGSVDSAENHAHCAHLAKGADLVVIAVDYRLAPENRFPAGLEDCYAAFEWVFANAELLGIDPARLAVGGGSAGGNLSAALALKARDESGPKIALQLLEAPALDFTLSSPSIHTFDAEFPAVRQMAQSAPADYFTDDADRLNPYASPLLAPSLAGLPRAVILTCEIDPVRDDGARYAERLAEAGVEVEATLYDGLLHGASTLTMLLPSARAWRAQCIAALRTL